MNENKNAITALVFSCIMLIAPIAGAASITTFSGGDSEVSIEVRDGPDYTNIVDGTVSLPSGDTVTSATVKVSTDLLLTKHIRQLTATLLSMSGTHSTTSVKQNFLTRMISLTQTNPSNLLELDLLPILNQQPLNSKTGALRMLSSQDGTMEF